MVMFQMLVPEGCILELIKLINLIIPNVNYIKLSRDH